MGIQLPQATPPNSTPAPSADVEEAPTVELRALDQLWFQVSGTVCNLRCNHCFISCSPENHSFWFMSRDEVRASLDASVRLGVKEYYFTGGEPFMNRDMLGILEDALALGPVTVLTNGTLLPQRTVDALAVLAAASPYTVEMRVSIDGVTAEMNDAIRGDGSFDRAIAAVGRLAAAGFLPIITTMQTWPEVETDPILSAFRGVLGRGGGMTARVSRSCPPLRIGAEASRDRGYDEYERVTREMMAEYPAGTPPVLECPSRHGVGCVGVPHSARLRLRTDLRIRLKRRLPGRAVPRRTGVLHLLGPRSDLLEHAWLRCRSSMTVGRGL